MAPKKKGISVNLRDLQREMGVGLTLLPSAPKPVDEAALAAAAEKERERERMLGPGGGRWADRMDDSDDDEWRRESEGANFGGRGEGDRREGGRVHQEVELPDEPWRRSAPLPPRDQEGGERGGRRNCDEEEADLGVLRSTSKVNPAGAGGDPARGGRGENAGRHHEEDLDFGELRKATVQREGAPASQKGAREYDDALDFAAVRGRPRASSGHAAVSGVADVDGEQAWALRAALEAHAGRRPQRGEEPRCDFPPVNDRFAALLESNDRPAPRLRPAGEGAESAESVTAAAPKAEKKETSPEEPKEKECAAEDKEAAGVSPASGEKAGASAGKFVPKWKQRMEEEKQREEARAQVAQPTRSMSHLQSGGAEENKRAQIFSPSSSTRVEEPVQILQPVRLGSRKEGAGLGGSFVNGKYVPSGVRAQSQQSPNQPQKESEVQRFFKAAAGSAAAGAAEDEEEAKRREELQKKKDEKERREREKFDEQLKKREELVKTLTYKEENILSLVQVLEKGLDDAEKNKALGVEQVLAVLQDEDELASIVPSAVVAAVLLKLAAKKETMEEVLELVQRVEAAWKALFEKSSVKDKDQVLIKEMVKMTKAVKCPRLSSSTALIEAVWDAMVATAVLSDTSFIRWFDDDNDDTEGRTEVLFQVLTWAQWLQGQLEGADAQEEEVSRNPEAENDDYDIEALVPKREGEKSTKKKK
ncbi:hypothetical protein BESB_055750 [Besnoitia besnoiti]|uniref:Uncharacterized protein n=1 Tax=Besnoitia besnoiti TaxID=94643 RepID=A0A2A9MFF3_BESBE|nr:hypothetical protein BESB_055750 [Besnoitia besnoiti]PFH35924.1 hypothetical protein BESB_055750 [Besnoitia besnoiti]